MGHKTLIATLVLLTGLHLAVAGKRRQDVAEATRVSTLAINVRLPAFSRREAGCRVYVAFHSTCPFCRDAAAKEASHPQYLPTTWIAAPDDVDWRSYVPRVHSQSVVVLDPDLYSLLEVRAVPAGFLVDEGGVVRWVWPYQGSETAAFLLEKCGPHRMTPLISRSGDAMPVGLAGH